MEVLQVSRLKQIRTSRQKSRSQFEHQIQGKDKIIKDEKYLETVGFNYEKKAQNMQQIHKNKLQGFMLFQNISINRSLIDACQHAVMEYDQFRKCTPDIRVLKRKRNGKIIFQTIPKLAFPKQQVASTTQQNFIISRLQLKEQNSFRLTKAFNDEKKGVFFSDRQIQKSEFLINNFQ
ncbi:unnamed protein product [Paramecium sonneborni]|uniref:Uncharacterized protein n=1 Tax=Paramecium sonneborni TaxID=65129 RepID=A0A8S1M3M6_9CILI|nr:unnamed protein product [Paramecium sonneborni]